MIYVDAAIHEWRGRKYCHMFADSTEELLTMGAQLNLSKVSLQYPGTAREHFDVTERKRAKAIQLGAVEVDRKWVVNRIRKK